MSKNFSKPRCKDGTDSWRRSNRDGQRIPNIAIFGLMMEGITILLLESIIITFAITIRPQADLLGEAATHLFPVHLITA